MISPKTPATSLTNRRWLHFKVYSTEPKAIFCRQITCKVEGWARESCQLSVRTFPFVQELLGGQWWLNPCNGSHIDVTIKGAIFLKRRSEKNRK